MSAVSVLYLLLFQYYGCTSGVIPALYPCGAMSIHLSLCSEADDLLRRDVGTTYAAYL
jgi:hypothetical protein